MVGHGWLVLQRRLLIFSFRLTQVLFWLGVSTWFGGLVVLGPVVAWQLFTTIGQAHVQVAGMNPQLDQSRELAGLVFGNILQIFYWIELVCLGLITGAAVGQMLLHLHLWNAGVWLRLLVIVLLAAVTLHDVFFVAPQVFSQHSQWVADLTNQPAAASVHEKLFKQYHASAEHDGAIETVLLLALLVISAWAIHYPTRKAYLRAIAGTSADTPAHRG